MHPLCCFSKSRMNKKKLDRDKLFYDTIKRSLWELLKLYINEKSSLLLLLLCKNKEMRDNFIKLKIAHMH